LPEGFGQVWARRSRVMSAQKHQMTPESVGPIEKGAVRRRGLIASAAALAAGILATRMGSEAVDAADGATILIGNTHDANNLFSTTTTLSPVAPATPNTLPAFRVINNLADSTPGAGSTPDTTADAIQGFASNPAAPPGTVNDSGVHGRNDALGGIGTTGVATNGTGVYGQSTSGTGVGALSGSGAAFYGTSTGTYGIFGQVSGTTAGAIGVYGANLSTVQNSHGIVGLAQTGHGLVGTCNAPPNAGFPYAGLVGLAGIPSANAGNFYGNVAIAGNLFIGGNYTATGTKSAAIAQADGSHRLVYCMESPESWLEDFGEGTLANGKAEVKIDPGFAAVADTSSYHVFITEHGDNTGIYTTHKGLDSLSVEADGPLAALKGKKATDLNGTFSYRIVAKRKDVKAARLATFSPPQTPAPNLEAAKLPKPPTLPIKRPQR
jgi:hypothetical protein